MGNAAQHVGYGCQSIRTPLSRRHLLLRCTSACFVNDCVQSKFVPLWPLLGLGLSNFLKPFSRFAPLGIG